MITVCINCYNDIPTIKRCVQSIYKQVDRIIAVDGRYRDFPSDNWYSTDGTREYLHSLGKVELLFGAGLFEADKRNIYMDALNEDDTVLVLDGDEYIEGSICKLDKNVDIGLVVFSSPSYKRRLATRFFRYRKGLRHEGIHFILTIDGKWFNNRQHAVNSFTDKNIQSFKIKHLLRYDKERKFQKEQYIKSARARESKYKIASYG